MTGFARDDLRARPSGSADGVPLFQLQRGRARPLVLSYQELRWLCWAAGPALMAAHPEPEPDRPAPAPLPPPRPGEDDAGLHS